MNIRSRLDRLARNLYWTWHPEAGHIFRDLNPELWHDVGHNPIAFLAQISDEYLNERIGRLALEARITRAFHTLRDYIEDEKNWGRRHAGSLRARPVAYFSAEFGLHESMPVYSGGLGVLAGDHVKASSDLGIPLIGVGLLYAKGYFTQTLDENGWQQEHYFSSDLHILPIEPVADTNGQHLRLQLKTKHGGDIWIEAWATNVGRCRLVLLDTNVEGNNDDNRQLTAQLYGGDSQMRIRQELVLGVGGMRVLGAMGVTPGVIHLNEGHSAFALLELARQLMVRDGQPFQDVQQKAAGMSVFTTHTPVAAGHDRFRPDQVENTLGPLRQELGLSEHEFMALGRMRPDDQNEEFCMTILGMKMTHLRNAVSFIHRRVSRKMWHGVWPERAEQEVPIGYITNGVHVQSWVAREMQRLYARWLPEGWQKRIYDPEVWEKVDLIDAEELWEINEILLAKLISSVREAVQAQCERRGEKNLVEELNGQYLRESVLTIGFARRFAPYKRGNLLLHDLDRLDRLVNNPERPVQIVFAGKAHPRDDEGKKMIQRLFQITRDPRFAGKIAFVEDYDIDVARHLVQGVHIWLNTPRRPLEACGTSGMKAVLNGVLNLSILDGWWAEAYDGTNGFAIGVGAEHTDADRQDKMDLEATYEVLENEVVPMFYERQADGLPRAWVQRQKRALSTLAWRFSAQRMVTEYARNCYLPLVGGRTSSFAASELIPLS